MRWLTGLVLSIVLAAPAFARDYVVLSGVKADDAYHAAALRLAAHHEAGAVAAFDPADPHSALDVLRAEKPRNVAVVVRPEHIDVNFVRRFLRMATQIDDDPFVDFDYGFITGATPEDALRFVERIVQASAAEQPRKVGSAAVWGGQGASRAYDDEYVLGALHLPRRSLRFLAPAGQDRDQAFLDKELSSLGGCGAILMGGHGMPWEIGHGPRAEDVGKLDLYPAVAFNYACHTGVTLRYPEREYKGANVVERLLEVERKRSFALNMIHAGVTGYIAYVNPRPAGPELSTDFARVLAGASLGESRRADQAKILLGYLGWGEQGIVPPTWEDGHARARRDVDPVRHMMLDGATGGILYGDPAFRPYPRRENVLPLAQALERQGEELHIAFALPAEHTGLWCADPFRKFPGGKLGMARKVYGRVELPADAAAIRSVWIDAATQGGQPLATLEPVWALEDDHGKRYLHLKANFDYGGQGEVAVRFVASARAEVPAEKRVRPQLPAASAKPGDLDVAQLVQRANEVALDARADLAPWLAELARRPHPASFDAILALIRRGDGHWRTHLLAAATRRAGDEARLMELAGGPALPRYGRWVALQSLGHFDTPQVRAWLLERLTRQPDAGLFMSASQALAMLREAQAHAPIARQVLAFESGWSGVEGHLLEALYAIAHPQLGTTLEAYARNEHAVQETRVWVALTRLRALDAGRAARAAQAVLASERFAAFGAGTQANIRALAEAAGSSPRPK